MTGALEPVLGGDDTIRRNFSKIEELYTAVEAIRTLQAADLATWRTIMIGSAGGSTWGTSIFAWGPTLGWLTPGSASANNTHILVKRYEPTDYDIAGKTTQIRVRGTFSSNATAPAISFTVGAYAISGPAGGAGVLSFSSMSAINTATVTTPAASTITAYVSTEATAPAVATNMVIGLLGSGSAAANHVGAMACAVEIRHV